MVSTLRQVDPPDAEALREDAGAVEAAAADLHGQIERLAAHPEPYILLAAALEGGPLPLTLPRDVVVQALGARLRSLDAVASRFHADARALESLGTQGVALFCRPGA